MVEALQAKGWVCQKGALVTEPQVGGLGQACLDQVMASCAEEMEDLKVASCV